MLCGGLAKWWHIDLDQHSCSTLVSTGTDDLHRFTLHLYHLGI